MTLSSPIATSYISPGSMRRFATFSASLPPSIKTWIEHLAKMEALQPVHDIPFMRATIRRHFPKLSNAAVEALLAVMIQQLLQPTNESDLSQATSMNLQMQMDRRAKLVATLSNLMKSLNDTAASITQNMK